MKKIFGGIDLTWKKLIIFAIITAFYTALVAIIPITKETSFRDIAIQFEWWILFGIIIICNSKSPQDSALKCFVFFLISQPLIYLLQVPFSYMGWSLFKYYRYWFIWTLLTLPMGFIGYYIKKKNVISMLILLPMLVFLTFLGLGYFNSMMNDFPHHMLSFIFCFVAIIIITLGVIDKWKIRITTLFIVLLVAIFIVIKGGIFGSSYETYRSLDQFDIDLNGEVIVSSFTGNTDGKVEVINASENIYSLKISGKSTAKYEFSIKDSQDNEYSFEYYLDEDNNTVILNRVDK